MTRAEIATAASTLFERLRVITPKPGYAAAFPWDSRPRLTLVQVDAGVQFGLILTYNDNQIAVPAARNLTILSAPTATSPGRASIEFSFDEYKPLPPISDRQHLIDNPEIVGFLPWAPPRPTRNDYEAEIRSLLANRARYSRRVLIAMLEDIEDRAAKDGIDIDLDSILFTLPQK